LLLDALVGVEHAGVNVGLEGGNDAFIALVGLLQVEESLVYPQLFLRQVTPLFSCMVPLE